MSKILGIIGGMGPLATVNLFNKIVINTDARSDQEHVHMLIDNNVNIPDRTAFLLGKGKDPTGELIKSAIRLEKAGADFLIMPCNTAHHFYETIKENISIDFLNMIEETVKFIQSKYPGIKEVGLLSTDGTLKAKIYDLYFNNQNIRVINPRREIQVSIMDIIYGIKAGKKEVQIDAIYEAAGEFRAKGIKVFVLGCTELSVVNEMFKLEEEFASTAGAESIADTENIVGAEDMVETEGMAGAENIVGAANIANTENIADVKNIADTGDRAGDEDIAGAANIANDADATNAADFIHAVDALNVMVRRAIEFAGKKVLNSSVEGT